MASFDSENNFKSKITAYVLACWILAAVGGLLFGYDIGISGIYPGKIILIFYFL